MKVILKLPVKSSENYQKQTMKCYCFGCEKKKKKEINPSCFDVSDFGESSHT